MVSTILESAVPKLHAAKEAGELEEGKGWTEEHEHMLINYERILLAVQERGDELGGEGAKKEL